MSPSQGRPVRRGLLSLLLLASAGSLGAQERSPVADFLTAARAALNDLRYSDADSISRAVLSLGQIRRIEKIQALQISAGAAFPEQASAQQIERAREVLRQLVRIAPSVALPREVSWTGLDALLVEVRGATFGAASSPQDRYTVTGPEERVEIGVATTRPTRFSLWLESETGGPTVFLDSLLTDAQGRLAFKVLADGNPRFTTGAYRLMIRAVDLAAPDTISMVYSARIEAPVLRYEEVPAGLPPGVLRPEMTVPKKRTGILAGLFALGATVAASRLLRDGDFKGASGSDGRAIGLGVALGLGTAAGVYFLERGEPIPANIKANADIREQLARDVAAVRQRNAELLRTYRAELTVNTEPRT